MISTGSLYEFVARAAAIGLAVPPAIERGLQMIEVAIGHMDAPAPLNLLQYSDDEIRARVESISIRRHSTGMGTQPGTATGGIREAQSPTPERAPRRGRMKDLAPTVNEPLRSGHGQRQLRGPDPRPARLSEQRGPRATHWDPSLMPQRG